MASSNKNLFESMTRRRVSCPQVTQQLWDAIKSIRNTRQVPTSERIQKIMQKEFDVNEEEVTRQLNHCVRDGLIEVTKRTVSKGNNAGSEQEWFALPSIKLRGDEYDWYCFDCHRAGDVICCSKSTCQRVYHLACIAYNDLPQEAFVCHVCKMCQSHPSKFQMKRSKLNRMLGHPLAKLKSKYPLTLKDQRLPPPNKNILVSDRIAQALNPPALPPPDESDQWRSYLLIAREMNLTIVEEKIDRHRYRLLEEFHADCLNILHNMVIYNGVDSAVADIARQMLRDCVEDLKEIRQCVDCYKMSHGQKKQWFAKPCRKPHELVYAKAPGQPYWPAKVMKVDGDQYDVRLFGAQHLRVVVPRSLTRPITVNIHSLQVKRSSGWNRACEELKKHQELLEKARVATHNFTEFIESSSSEESESVDSETEKKMERDLRNSKVKFIIEKQAVVTKQKPKPKRRRNSITVSTVSSGEKKRGRPRLTETPKASPVKVSRPSRKRKETYDSSDSLETFKTVPKRNTEEVFDELLKSGPTNLPKGNDDTKPEPKPRRQTAKLKPIGKRDDLSEESKTKSDTLDSSTMSSIDTDASVLRKIPNFPTKKYSSSDDSDSDSDFGSSSPSSARRSRVRSRPLRPKRLESKTKDASYDDTTSTDSDSDKDKMKTNGKIDDSSSLSSDSDDDSLVKKVPITTLSLKGRSLSKLSKKKDSGSSDSDSKTLSRRSSLDAPTLKKPLPKTLVDTKLIKEKPASLPSRSSLRNANKTVEPKPEVKNDDDDDDDSSDSEAPLSAKTCKKSTDLVRDILKKFATNRVASDSDSKSNKLESGSDTDDEKNVKNQKKDAEKKPKCKSNIKEEHKEETLVSSSSQEPSTRSIAVQTVNETKPRPDRISELEKELQMQAKTNRLLEMEFDKTKVLIERMRSDHDDEISEINARHSAQISEIKKKQWCYNCEMEAIYHCCWNTAYCSVECQQAHWQSEHKRVCRRKR